MAGSTGAWGVDVGVSSLKAIKLRRDGDHVVVEAFEVIEHEKFLTEPDVDRDALIRTTLQKFITKYNLRRERVFIGVPGSTTFARFVKLPPVETKKIPEIVRFEAIQQIPFPLEQVNWDYHTFQHPDSPDVEVGIFAMKKELVAAVMSNFQQLGMTVEGVQMSPLAVYNAAEYDGMTDGKGTILIDMGAEHTDLVIMEQGRLWMRTINIGGNHFTDALAKSFKRSFTQAEQLKKTAATSKYQKQIYQAMRPVFADLTAEIQRSIGFYNSSHRDSRLERIVGMGNPFRLPNLQKYLQQELKLEVIRLETFTKASVENAAALNENILSMTSAYGLAVQALGLAAIDTNLLPLEIARKMMWRNKQPWFIGATALVGVGALALVLQWYTQSSAFGSSEQERLRSENKAVIGNASQQEDKWRNNVQVPTFKLNQAKVGSQLALAADRSVWPHLMKDVLESLPQSSGRGQQGTIVITSISGEYTGMLSTAVPFGTNNQIMTITPGAPPSLIPPPILDPRQFPGGLVPPQPQQVAPPPTPGEAAVAVGPGESDHGYLLYVSGYTATGRWETVDAYFKAMTSRATKKAKDEDYHDRPYYFDPFNTSQLQGKLLKRPQVGGMGGTPAAVTGPWGNVHGPFWDVMVPDMLGIKPPSGPVPGGGVGPGLGGGMGMGGGLGAVDPVTGMQSDFGGPIDMMTSNPKNGVRLMYDYYTFSGFVKVHVVHVKP